MFNKYSDLCPFINKFFNIKMILFISLAWFFRHWNGSFFNTVNVRISRKKPHLLCTVSGVVGVLSPSQSTLLMTTEAAIVASSWSVSVTVFIVRQLLCGSLITIPRAGWRHGRGSVANEARKSNRSQTAKYSKQRSSPSIHTMNYKTAPCLSLSIPMTSF